MSQYAKAGEMRNRRMHAALSPIFEFRSAESGTLLQATLKLCRNIRVSNEIFLQINEQCKHSSHSTEQITELVPAIACGQTESTTFAQRAHLVLESSITKYGLSVPTPTTQRVSAYDASDLYPRFGETAAQKVAAIETMEREFVALAMSHGAKRRNLASIRVPMWCTTHLW